MIKKLLFSCISMLMLCGGAFAGEVIDELTNATFGVSGTTYTETSRITVTSNAVYAAQSAGGNSAIQLRSNNNNSGIVTTASGGKLKSITIEFNSNTNAARVVSVYGKNEAYSNPTELYSTLASQGDLLGEIAKSNPDTLTIEGDYTYFGLRSKSGALYIDKITVVWEDGTTTTETTAKKPVITPNGGKFEESIDVTISSESETAKLYYKLNDAAEFTLYEAPFTLTESATVTAYAYDEACDNKESAQVSATFTKIETVEATCAEINAGEDGTVYRVKGTVTNIKNTTYGNWYLQDATGEVYIFGTLDAQGNTKNFSSLGIEEGDIVTVEGPKQTYNGTVELVNVTVLSIEKGSTPIVETVEAPVFTPNGGEFEESIEVELACATEGATIYYRVKDTNGTIEWTVYSEPIVLTESATLVAYAAKEGMDKSADVTAVFTKKEAVVSEYDYEYTFSGKVFSEEGTQTLEEIDWTLATDGGFFGHDKTKGQQIGSSKLPATKVSLSTEGFGEKEIAKVTVEASGAKDIEATLAVEIGGNAFGNEVELTNASTKYDFAGEEAASGKLEIKVANNSQKAVYVKFIGVVYKDTTVGISTVKNVSLNGAAFNLQGQRVAQPAKGLYIMNGKKVILK